MDSRMLWYGASRTTPTTSKCNGSFANFFPMGLSPLKNCLAKVSFTIAAPGDVSPGRKSLPVIKGILIVCIQPGETLRKYASTGPGGAPLTETNPFQDDPPSNGHRLKATVSTPGVERKRSAT